VYSFLWIGLVHAAQYLWITTYFARKDGIAASAPAFYAKALAAGAVVWTLPVLLFAPGRLGAVPYDAGLALMVAALVNIHHFVLDGVIWKLRDGPIARILLRSETRDRPRAPRRWVWPAIGALGIGLAGVSAYGTLWTEFGYARPLGRGDVDTASAAADSLATIGRESAEMHLQLGLAEKDRGHAAAARRHFERSVELHPTAHAWTALGDAHARESRLSRARICYAQALALDPDDPFSLFSAARAALAVGDHDAARSHLDHAQALPVYRREHPEALWDAIDALQRRLPR
jgi:tetratricopeptide (TPR) repeat protein